MLSDTTLFSSPPIAETADWDQFGDDQTPTSLRDNCPVQNDLQGYAHYIPNSTRNDLEDSFFDIPGEFLLPTDLTDVSLDLTLEDMREKRPPIQGSVHQSSSSLIPFLYESVSSPTNLSSPVNIISNGWVPRRSYREVRIGDLRPAPDYVQVFGRIIGIWEGVSKSESGGSNAKGSTWQRDGKDKSSSLNIVIRDDDNTLLVRLWFSVRRYTPRLGQLLRVWTPQISKCEPGKDGMGNGGMNSSPPQIHLPSSSSFPLSLLGSCPNSNSTIRKAVPAAATLFTSVHPESERDSHVDIFNEWGDDIGSGDMVLNNCPHQNQFYDQNGYVIASTGTPHTEARPFTRPLGLGVSRLLRGLISLRNLSEGGGGDIADGKVLVCVKSVSTIRKVTCKNGKEASLVSITIFDDSAEASLTLWDAQTYSSIDWSAYHTLILITNPGWKILSTTNSRSSWKSSDGSSQGQSTGRGSSKGKWMSEKISGSVLIHSNSTLMDIDPDLADAEWLRKYAIRRKRAEGACLAVPADVFRFDITRNSPDRVLYTLRELDNCIRDTPNEIHMGFLSLILARLNLIGCHAKNRLFGGDCRCGAPVFSNSSIALCSRCDHALELGMNPYVISQVLDETGTLSAGKLLLTPQAWQQLLLNTTPDQLSTYGVDQVERLQSAIVFQRVTVLFGWIAEEGKELRPKMVVPSGTMTMTRGNNGRNCDGRSNMTTPRTRNSGGGGSKDLRGSSERPKTTVWEWPADGVGYIYVDEVLFE